MENKKNIFYAELNELKLPEKSLLTYTKTEVKIATHVVKKFGMQLPLLIDDKNIIIHGKILFKAAQKLKIDKVPVIKIENLTEQEIQMFSLAINKVVRMGEFDLENIKFEIQDWMINTEILPEELGMTTIEIDNLLFSIEPEKSDLSKQEIILPEIEQVVKPGDLIKLGRHFLLCGDSLEGKNYQLLMKNDKADIVIADPPYNVKISGNVTKQNITKNLRMLQEK